VRAPLKIAVASAGRFHVLDLARELHALGHEVRFYSYLPRSRARAFGLPDRCSVSLFFFAAPVLAWERLAPRLLPLLRERLLYAVLNFATMLRLRPCDVFVCMSGIYLEAPRAAKRRYGASVWLHRGSRHILSQDEILSEIPGAERPSPLAIRRELAGYELADRILIQTRHVAESFERDPAAYAKLCVIPTGANLSMFPCAPRKPPSEPLSLLFTGNWSLRKGCDLLADCVRRLGGVRLTHVGPIGDVAFPAEPRFAHVDAVPQASLKNFYAGADLFVLASREEGLSQVLIQALACGLPIVCTDRSGGADLAHTPALAARITVVPHGDVGALATAVETWRERLRAGDRLPPLTDVDREALSWTAYGRRYERELVAAFAAQRPNLRALEKPPYQTEVSSLGAPQ